MVDLPQLPSGRDGALGLSPRRGLGAGRADRGVGSLFRRFPGLRLVVPVERLELRADKLTGGFTALPVTW